MDGALPEGERQSKQFQLEFLPGCPAVEPRDASVHSPEKSRPQVLRQQTQTKHKTGKNGALGRKLTDEELVEAEAELADLLRKRDEQVKFGRTETLKGGQVEILGKLDELGRLDGVIGPTEFSENLRATAKTAAAQNPAGQAPRGRRPGAGERGDQTRWRR